MNIIKGKPPPPHPIPCFKCKSRKIEVGTMNDRFKDFVVEAFCKNYIAKAVDHTLVLNLPAFQQHLTPVVIVSGKALIFWLSWHHTFFPFSLLLPRPGSSFSLLHRFFWGPSSITAFQVLLCFLFSLFPFSLGSLIHYCRKFSWKINPRASWKPLPELPLDTLT